MFGFFFPSFGLSVNITSNLCNKKFKLKTLATIYTSKMMLGIVSDGLNCTFLICPLFYTHARVYLITFWENMVAWLKPSSQMLSTAWSQKSQAKFKSRSSECTKRSVPSLTQINKKRVKGGESREAMLFWHTIKIINLYSWEILRCVHSLGSFLFKGRQCV